MDFSAKYGSWALVTGATSGIGEELTNQIAAKGLNLILVARKEAPLREKAAALSSQYGIETKYIPADLSSPEGLEKIKTGSAGLEVGLLVLVAGKEVNGAFEKNNLEEELQVVRLNVIATLTLTHHYSGQMVKRGKGGILLVASLSGHMPNPYFANYAGSKAYMLNFGASLFGELKPKGVDVTVLSPGLTSTPMSTDTGVDWGKTPMSALPPEVVAKTGLDALGHNMLAIPGMKNKVMAAMAKHSPLEMQSKMNEKMMRAAIAPGKL
jgi:short-subunit dehydrogenase